MRYLIVLLGVMSAGCATTRVYSDSMQPDGSYRILAGGNVIASADDARNEAHMRAQGLCPFGYRSLSEMQGSQGLKPRYQLIVMCNK